MSRDDGFKVADIDTGLPADPKVVALARRLRGGIRTAAAMGLHEALLLASWRLGERVTIDEALPAWFLDDPGDLVAALRDVRLIDAEGRIPERAWAGWFGPALDRRFGNDFGRVVGGLVAHGMPREEAVVEARRRQTEIRERLLGPASQPGSITRLPSVRSFVRPSVQPGGVTKPGDSLGSALPRSRPGSRRDRDERLKEDGEAKAEVERQRLAANGAPQ